MLTGREVRTEDVLELLNDPDVEILGWVEGAAEAMEMAEELRPDALVADATVAVGMRELTSPVPMVILPGLGDSRDRSRSGELELLRTCLALATATPG